MRCLLRYRFYILLNHKKLWIIGAFLVLFSVALMRGHRLEIQPEPCFLGVPSASGPELNAAFYALCGPLSTVGYLFLFPAVLCAFLTCEDYSRPRLIPVVSAGYGIPAVHGVQGLYLLLLQTGMILITWIVEALLLWPQVMAVASDTGWEWLLQVFCGHLLCSVGNLALFFLLTSFCGRYEVPLCLGFLLFAMDAMGSDFGLLTWFPSGALQCAFAPAEWGVILGYAAELCMSILLAAFLPVWLPSKLRMP